MEEHFVKHPVHGNGKVVDTRYLGFELRVEFDSGLTYWLKKWKVSEWKGEPKSVSEPTPLSTPAPKLSVPHEAVAQLECQTIAPPRVEPPVQPKLDTVPIQRQTVVYRKPMCVESTNEIFHARKLIEALRLGVVPFDCVQDFTFGRETETSQIENWLRDSNPQEGAMAVVGEYGSGKTHLLQWTFPRAIDLGFGAASIEMDPNETPFHKPINIYRRFTSSFRYRCPQDKTIKGFRDLLREAFSRGYFQDHPYFGLLYRNKDDEEYWQWIEGARHFYYIRPCLYDHTTAGNIYTYLISSLGWFVSQVLGLKGILLGFDEAESINMSYGTNKQRAQSFLNALIRTASNEERLTQQPTGCGLIYSGHSGNIPFLYRSRCGLKILLAFTSPEMKGRTVLIEPFTRNELDDIVAEIHRFYETAYSCKVNGSRLAELQRTVLEQTTKTRGFIKASVEALDIARLSSSRDDT